MDQKFSKEAYAKAYEYEKKIEGCSQPLLLALFELLNIEDDLMLKAVSGFAGGISRMKSTCGALLTGILILGIKYGRGKKDLDKFENLLKSYIPVQTLFKWFIEEFGTTNCFEITRVDLSNPIERNEWITSGKVEFCNQLIGKTAEKVSELLEGRI